MFDCLALVMSIPAASPGGARPIFQHVHLPPAESALQNRERPPAKRRGRSRRVARDSELRFLVIASPAAHETRTSLTIAAPFPPAPCSISHLFLLAVVLWCAIPLSPNTVDSDFWGHVAYGRDMLRFGLDRTATYTYTARDYPWINHENLSEILFAFMADRWGVASLLVLKCLLGMLVLWLVIAHGRRQQVGTLLLAAFCVLTAVNLSFYWGLRPHMLTFAMFALLMAWLERCFAGWSGQWQLPWSGTGNASQGRGDAAELDVRRLHGLWLGLPLLAVWANTHGAFLAGLGIYLAILGCRGLEYALSHHIHRRRVLIQLSLLAVAGVAVTLLNPYGAGLHLGLAKELSIPRPEIQEWNPPDLWSTTAAPLWALLIVAGVGLVGSRRPRDFTQLVVLALVTYQVLRHQRHLPFLAILVAFWLPPHVQSVAQRVWALQRNTPSPLVLSRQLHVVLAGTLLAICSLLLCRVGQRLQGVTVPRDRFPVSALQYMADRDLTGRLVVAGPWSQYAIAVCGARLPQDHGVQVAFDGRFRTCYPQEVIDLHFDFFQGDAGSETRYRSPLSPPADPTRVLRVGDPDLVLLNRRDPATVSAMEQVAADWVLLYQDRMAQLWGRVARYGLPESSDYLPPAQRMITTTAQMGSVPWPGAPELARSRNLADTNYSDPESFSTLPVRHD